MVGTSDSTDAYLLTHETVWLEAGTGTPSVYDGIISIFDQGLHPFYLIHVASSISRQARKDYCYCCSKEESGQFQLLVSFITFYY